MSKLTLPQCNTLEEVETETSSDAFIALLKSIWDEQDEELQQAQILEVKAWEQAIKEKFHPENSNTDLQNLRNQVMAALATESGNGPNEQYRQLLLDLAAKREECKESFKRYEKVIGRLSTKVGVIAMKLNTGSGRSNRAKRAGLLSKHAGQNKIVGASTDKHGNAKGEEYDLGVDGAFVGMKIVVLQLYFFDSQYTKRAFEKKGFSYEWQTSVPSEKELRTLLLEDPTVCQLWVIGSNSTRFTTAHLDIIKVFYESGRSLYIWGDNTPFIAEANQVLGHLFGPTSHMFGDVPGGKVVNVIEDYNSESSKSPRGFIPHLMSTGLLHVFEGITVASFNEKDINLLGFTPFMWGSAGNLITILKSGSNGCGGIVADGAFTRLYCNVDDAGTIRYIINAACWLAIESAGGAATEFPSDFADEQDQQEQTYNEENAYPHGVCSILFEKTPISCLSVLEVGNPEDIDRNTSDFVLNDPLAYGEQNCRLLGRHLYAQNTGKAVLDMGKDPYLRQTVAGLLPAVHLGHPMNLNLFSNELCRVFMGGKALHSQAQQIFVAVLDSLLSDERVANHEPGIVEVLQYFLDQSLKYFKSTPDFTDVGDKLPLIDAMKHYFTVSPAITQISKSFNTVCLMARTLHQRGLVPLSDLTLIVRRSYIKLLVANAIRYVKENSTDGNANGNHTLQLWFKNNVYKCWNNIPTANTARLLTCLPTFIVPEIYTATLQRFERATGQTVSFDSVNTELFRLLTRKDLRMFRPEALLIDITKSEKSPLGRFWGGEVDAITPESVMKQLNSIFAKFTVVDKIHNESAIIPFATTYGPTVFSCYKCNEKFGDYKQEETLENAMAVKQARNAHFRAHLDSDVNGYPTDTSNHYSLHRSVQIVLSTNFADSKEFEEKMVTDVADRVSLLKGNIYRPNLPQIIEAVIKSYLECRNRGQPDFTSNIDFFERYKLERKVLLEAQQ